MKTMKTWAAAAALLAMSSVSHAALVDRGGGLIYDDVLNVTWLQDANYAKTSGYDSDGVMNWFAAMAWADNLSYFDPVRGAVYSDWRLPATQIQTQGYNQTGSELGSLYYLSLGNIASAYTTKNTAPFTNVFLPGIDYSVFWSSASGVESTNQGSYPYAFTFIFNDGVQDRTDPAYFERFAWAVRDGDVAPPAPVPVPAAWGLLLVGLGAMRLMSRVRAH